ncbi:MAG: glycosyl hydrolase [Acutalibacteraceae bacterium]
MTLPGNYNKQSYIAAFEAAKAQNSAILGAFDHMNRPAYDYDYNNYSHIVSDYSVTPAIYHTFYPYSNGSIKTEEANKRIIEHYKEGALCMVFVQNNWANDIISATYSSLDNYDALTEKQFIVNFDADYTGEKIAGVYETYLYYRSQWADAFEELKDAGVTVIFRPFVEMTNKLHRDCYTNTAQGYKSFKNVWIQLHDYMEKERGLDNIIWCFAPQAGGGWSNQYGSGGRNFYPGNDYVDIIGLTLYSNGDETYKYNFKNDIVNYSFQGYYDTGKPVGFSELGVSPVTVDGVTQSGDFKALLDNILNTPLKDGKTFAGNISFASVWTEDYGLFGSNNVGQSYFINNDFFIDLQELKALRTN